MSAGRRLRFLAQTLYGARRQKTSQPWFRACEQRQHCAKQAPMSHNLGLNQKFEAHYGTAVEINSGVRRLVANNPGPMTFKGTGTFLIGNKKLAVIDPGPDDDEHLEALLKAIGTATLTHILITHTHLDHSPLAARLKAATGAETYGVGPHGLRTSGYTSPVEGFGLEGSGDMDFVPDHVIGHGDIIDGPDFKFDCVFTPGHSANHMAFALDRHKALFVGDLVMGWSTSVVAPPDGNMAEYMASLRMVRARDDAVYWPTHGAPIEAPNRVVKGYITHRNMRENAILKTLGTGPHKIQEIVLKIYQGLSPKLHGAAALSVLAHMEHLHAQGKIECDGVLSLEATYSLR